MSAIRQQRLQRLVDLRAKELDRRVKELSVARVRQNKIEEEHCRAKAERLDAVAARTERARAGLPAGDWGHAENWLTGLSQKELLAERQRQMAAREVVGARGRVTEAMLEREKIDLLMGRLATEVRKEETRLERKSEDEHASVHHRGTLPKRST